jgi:hypothetical protein
MANNTPITARISKGLFGKSSSKVTEPLLNVGPAGVSGNNQTKDIPSPSKMKSAFKMMSSPFKQTVNDKPLKDTTVTKNEDKETKSSEEVTSTSYKTGSLTGKKEPQMSPAEWAAYTAAESVGDKLYRKNFSEVKRGIRNAPTESTKKETIETTKKTPQPDTVEDANILTKDKGDAQTSQDRRGNIRSGKVVARQEKRATIKEDRLQRKVDKGGYSAGKTSRLNAKLQQAKTNKIIAKQERENVEAQSLQNISSTSDNTVVGKARIKTQSDVGNPNVTNPNIGRTTTVVSGANNNTATAGTSTPTVNTGGTLEERTTIGGFKGAGVKAAEGPTKKDNGFFAKKSPMKLKYFK